MCFERLEARFYVDDQCVKYEKPLLESGASTHRLEVGLSPRHDGAGRECGPSGSLQDPHVPHIEVAGSLSQSLIHKTL